MITYQTNLENISASKLSGFWINWPTPPSNEKFYQLLEGSAYIVLAVDDATGNVIGFINAISDDVMSAYIPLLEVLPKYQEKGIGRELVQRMLKQLDHLYMIDICCDEDLVQFYENQGFTKVAGMIKRNYHNISKP